MGTRFARTEVHRAMSVSVRMSSAFTLSTGADRAKTQCPNRFAA